jgi:hypothetical protein
MNSTVDGFSSGGRHLVRYSHSFANSQEAHDCNDRDDLSAALGKLSDGLEKLAEAEGMLRAAGDHAGADSLRAKSAEYGGFGTAVARRLSQGVNTAAAAAAAAAAA